jgi:hypothetical protein
MSKGKLDNIWIGMLAGLLGALAGFMLFGLGFAYINHISFGEFYHGIFLGVQDFQSRIVTFSMLIDVLLFFFFMKKDYQQFCKGLIAVLVIAVMVVALLY